jgi:hypothetical protein
VIECHRTCSIRASTGKYNHDRYNNNEDPDMQQHCAKYHYNTESRDESTADRQWARAAFVEISACLIVKLIG